ncbi:MAG TPA: dephospho-CoA kinase [Aldersonia sp.]
MLRVGLTGGMGAGKSTVARRLTELGGHVVDADAVAREVVERGTPGLAALVDAFGADILADDGSLDRPALAAKAFRTDADREQLNSITHPLVGKRMAELIEAAPSDAVFVYDVPLLVENGTGAGFNLVLVVDVPVDERVRRLVEYRGVDEADARARISAQATDEQRRAAADVLLDNSGPEGALDSVVTDLWHKRLVPFERNGRERRPVTPHPELVPHRPEWAAQAERIIARLRLVCGERALRVDHVGSTAVPALVARDVLDLQVTVADLDVADELAEALAQAGFPQVAGVSSEPPKPEYGIGGEADPGLWAQRLHASADPGRPADVHVRVDGWPGQRFALVLRDWLRADPQVRAEFQAAKHRARVDGELNYSEALEPWFDRAYNRAWDWADENGWEITAS